MVARTRELEAALGSREKFVAENEQETVIIQRRCLRARESIRAGEALTRDRIAVLRPATPGAIQPFEIGSVIGTHARIDIPEGEALRWTMLEV
jgi:N-acetylneuraminate synthase